MKPTITELLAATWPIERPHHELHWLFRMNNDRWRYLGWPLGTLFSIDYHTPIKSGDLLLVIYDDRLKVAQWLINAAEECWLLTPGELIYVAKRSTVAILGILAPTEKYKRCPTEKRKACRR